MSIDRYCVLLSSLEVHFGASKSSLALYVCETNEMTRKLVVFAHITARFSYVIECFEKNIHPLLRNRSKTKKLKCTHTVRWFAVESKMTIFICFLFFVNCV